MITGTCTCGKTYSTQKGDLAGKVVACRSCHGTFTFAGATTPPRLELAEPKLNGTPAPRLRPVTEVHLVGVSVPFSDVLGLLFQLAFGWLIVSACFALVAGVVAFLAALVAAGFGVVLLR